MRMVTAKGYLAAVAVSFAVVSAGCSGSGDGGSPSASSATRAGLRQDAPAPSFAYTADEYGMENPTYLSATTSTLGIVLRSAVAYGMTDPDYRTVSRIDVEDPGSVSPGVGYALGSGGGGPSFPGSVYFFNGRDSMLLQNAGGTITFTSFGSDPGDEITGRFSALVLDGYDQATPKGRYTIAASFTFTVNGSGFIVPTPLPVPAEAEATYQAKCASCHSLGALDPAANGAPDLALKGGKVNSRFTAGAAGHDGIALSPSVIIALKTLFNVN